MPRNKLTLNEAKAVVIKLLGSDKVTRAILYNDQYIFQIFSQRQGEENDVLFFSVDINTSDVKDFSIITDGNTEELVDRLLNQNLLESKGNTNGP